MRFLHAFHGLGDRQKRLIISAGALFLIALMGILVVVIKPFRKEQVQVAELRTIGQDEKTVSNVSSDIRSYVRDDTTVKYVDQALLSFQGGSGAAATSTPVPSVDPFNIAAIDAEASLFATTTQLINSMLAQEYASSTDAALQQF